MEEQEQRSLYAGHRLLPAARPVRAGRRGRALREETGRTVVLTDELDLIVGMDTSLAVFRLAPA